MFTDHGFRFTRGASRFVFLLFCGATIFCVSLACDSERKKEPDLIFFGGEIITMADTVAGSSDAVLVQNGRIVRVGSRDEIFAARREGTRLIDLAGRTLMPGFIAVHTHPDLAAYLHSFVDLSGFTNRTPDEVWKNFNAAVAAAKPGDWILCKGFDPMLVPGLVAPTRGRLDELAPKNPVFIISQNLHSAWANSRAFAAVGVTAETPDPAPGSFYETNDQGELTGLISEIAAIKPFSKAALGVVDLKSSAVAVLNDYASNGISTIATPGLFAQDSKPLLLFEHLSTGHPGFKHLALEYLGFLPRRSPTVRHFIYIQPDSDFLLPESVENGDDRFRILGVKLWYDGSPYVGSMLLDQPYLDSPLMRDGLNVAPGSHGEAKYSPKDFYDLVQKYHSGGWQVAVHSQGDRATREVLDVFERVLHEHPRPDHRHRLEHGLLTPGTSLERINALGMTPSFHLNHLYYYGEALKESIIGAQRAELMLPLNSVRAAGLRFSLHADLPMYPEVPLSLAATAVERKTRDKQLLIGANEKIEIYDALKALTVHAAYQLHMQDKIGSIETGKYADFTILDRNPLNVTPDQLRDITVAQTYVQGQLIYDRLREHSSNSPAASAINE